MTLSSFGYFFKGTHYRQLIFLLLLTLLPATSFAQTQPDGSIPTINRYVTDLSGTLSADQVNTLNQQLVDFDKQTSNQVIVLIVPTIGDQAIEDYSIAVAEKNKVGKKGRDNGVLFLIAINDHKMRIETGYGLEGALPDAVCSEIIRNIVAPKFRESDFYGGVSAGINAIMLATKGEFKGVPHNDTQSDKVSARDAFLLVKLGIFLLIVFASFFSRRMRGGGRYRGGPGGFTSGFLLGNILGNGFGGGGFGGGGFGGGGGFSGGGGGFGGGGASGGW